MIHSLFGGVLKEVLCAVPDLIDRILVFVLALLIHEWKCSSGPPLEGGYFKLSLVLTSGLGLP